jgi:alkanesulfonate monooxygenase SsuD/methylene tetrahydromethanopterin reductase-like flavin-dependent oxidoreductase (luciferase family)
MKFGVFLNSQHAASDDPRRRFDEMAEQVRLVRQLGFDSVWGGEHHITDGYHYFPLLPLMPRALNSAPISCCCPCTTLWKSRKSAHFWT